MGVESIFLKKMEVAGTLKKKGGISRLSFLYFSTPFTYFLLPPTIV